MKQIRCLNHLTSSRSGFINPVSGCASLHSCLPLSLPPFSPLLRSLQRRRTRPHVALGSRGSTCGRAAFWFSVETLCGGEKFLQIELGHFPIMIINLGDHTRLLLGICFHHKPIRHHYFKYCDRYGVFLGWTICSASEI